MLAVVVSAAALAGCGGDGGDGGGGADAQQANRTVPAVRVAPGPDAIAARREQDLLLDAYAPVAEHVNFLTSAVRLHALDLDQGGAVRREVAAYRQRLVVARTRITALDDLNESSEARELLVASLDARLDALRLIEAWLDVERVRPVVAERRWERYREAWNSSVGSARGALNLLQQDRARLGLAPAAEDSVR